MTDVGLAHILISAGLFMAIYSGYLWATVG